MTTTLTNALATHVTAYRAADIEALNAEADERWSDGSKAVIRRHAIVDTLRADGHTELAHLLRREHHARRGLLNALNASPATYDEADQEVDERLAHLAATRTEIRRYLEA